LIQPIDIAQLQRRLRAAKPFPCFVIDNFLNPDFAQDVYDSFPPYEVALSMGRSFKTVNERKKVQVTDAAQFAPAVQELNRLLAEPSWTEMLSETFGLPHLLADEQLRGGGMHQTGSRGRLDVHVDFNYIAEQQWHRRLNVLVFLNPGWRPEWGGKLEFWDKEVRHCHQSLEPIFNRCVVFETSDISFHGVTAVTCPEDRSRRSFAAYYYTREAPAHWTGDAHDTIFRSRPNEVIRGKVLMPVEQAGRVLRRRMEELRRTFKKMI